MGSVVLQTFKDYIGIKLHFNKEAFLWNENIGNKLTEETLSKRKDILFIEKFSKKFKKREDRLQYLISCALNDPTFWIGDIMTHDCKERHQERMKRIGALYNRFEIEVENISDFMIKNNLNVKSLLLTNGSRPVIIRNKSKIVGGVSDETLALLDWGFKFLKQETSDPLWEQKAFLLSKYKYLLSLDKNKLVAGLEKLAAIEGLPQQDCNFITQKKEEKICHLPI